jgi:hemerythrin
MIALNKDMEVGVGNIDGQHRELVDGLNTLVAASIKSDSQEEMQNILNYLEKHLVSHFSHEESMLKQSGDPKYEWHRNQHQYYMDEFNKLKNEFAENGCSDQFLANLNKSIINWIVMHIKTADAEFGKHYKTSREIPIDWLIHI